MPVNRTHHTTGRGAASLALAVLAALAATAVLLTGCGTGDAADAAPLEQDASAAGSVTITDCGRELTVPDPPQQPVSIAPVMTDLLVALRQGGAMVGQAKLDELVAGRV